ncbi:MAG: hypothetical protein JWR09_5547, partial [Mucilaginibacter sp.]|nr:hypothetical protein [Mucilaginibacter sp.]
MKHFSIIKVVTENLNAIIMQK